MTTITKSVLVFGNKEILIATRQEKETGLPVITLADFCRDISGEDLKELDTTMQSEVQLLVGDMHAAKALHEATGRVLALWEHWESQE